MLGIAIRVNCTKIKETPTHHDDFQQVWFRVRRADASGISAEVWGAAGIVQEFPKAEGDKSGMTVQ